MMTNLRCKIVLLATSLLLSGVAMAQIKIGYTNGKLSRTDILRFGDTKSQGMAVYIDAEKSAMLKGAAVSSFFTYVSTTKISKGTFFITKELGSTSLFEQEFLPTSSRERMMEYKLENTYVLDGEPFFFGYMVEAETSYKPLSLDQSNATEEGISWAYENGKWIDVSAKGYGVPNIQLGISGVQEFTDLSVRPIHAEGYQVAGEPQVFSGQVFNFGSQTVTSFDLECSVGTSEPIVTSVTGVSLESGHSYDFTLPAQTVSESGMLDLKVSVSNINGSTDAEVSDNTATSLVFFYPAGVEKKILVEVFTGQTCGQCPSGHANLVNALKGIEDEFIEVAHHAGFYPDMFTLEDSYMYTWFYGNAGTYAPAMMFNRTVVPSISTTIPVFAGTEAQSVKSATQAFRTVQPYVGLQLFNTIDTTTRKGVLVVDVETFVKPSDSIHTLNVWLVQDSLVAMQNNGGTAYVHNHVFRGVLLGNTWGLQIPLVPGETLRRTIEYEIPATIAADYGDFKGTEFDAVLSNMHIVAFVSDFSSSDFTACNVYNAAKIPVLKNESAESVEHTESEHSVLFSYNGSQMNLIGDFLQADFYTASGALATSLKKGQRTFNLPAGLYVVRTLLPSGTVDVQKLVIK